MSNIRRSFALNLAQQYGCAAIAFISVVILARLLTPAEVGIYSVSAAVISVAHMLRDFGIGRYLIQESDLSTERFRTAYGIGIAIAWSLAAALFAFRWPFAEFYADDRLADVISVLALNFVVIPFGAPIVWMLMRDMKFGQLFVINVSSQTVQAVLAVVLAALGYSYMSMAWSSLAGALTTTVLASLIDRKHAFMIPSLSGARRILSFGLWSSGQSITYALGNSAADLILGRTLGFAETALYSRARGLIGTVYDNPMKAVIAVALPTLAEQRRRGTDQEQGFLKGVGYLMAVIWPIVAFLAIMAYPLIDFLFGVRWIEAAPLLRLMALSGLAAPIIVLASQLLLSRGQVKSIFRLEVAWQALRVVMLLVGSPFGLVAVAALQLIPAVCGTGLWLRAIHKEADIRVHGMLGPSLHAAGVVLFASAGPVAVLFAGGAMSDFMMLALAGILWAAGWLLGVLALRHPIAEEVYRLYALSLGAFAAARPRPINRP